MKTYWLIKVSYIDTYSFLVHCGARTDFEAIDIARDADLFRDYSDWQGAVAEVADRATIDMYQRWNLIHEL